MSSMVTMSGARRAKLGSSGVARAPITIRAFFPCGRGTGSDSFHAL